MFVGEELASLQLQQRPHEDEELAAGLEIEPVLLREPSAEGDHDLSHVDLGERQLLAQEERQQQVEWPLERVEVEVELMSQHLRENLTRRADASLGHGHRRSLRRRRAGHLWLTRVAADELPPDEE